MPPHRPRSPCIKLCALDLHGQCAGCYRTIEEIAGWQNLSEREQWAVLEQLPRRVVSRAAAID